MRLILQSLLILIIIATISICAIQPDLHKNVIVYDSSYTLVSEEDVKIETKDIPIMEMTVKTTPVTTKVEQKVTPSQTVKKNQNYVSKQQTLKTSKTITTEQKNKSKLTQKIVNNPVETKTVSSQQKEVKVFQPQKEKQIVTTVQQKALTQQEENIAWNRWRSVLTNKIMEDTKLPFLPNGILFKFSFTVDTYGKITNVQTGADPSNYTPYAIQYIAPVIRSYQGHSILNFPEGTARFSTQVSGKWRISSTEKYSTPQDYNDIEKIIR